MTKEMIQHYSTVVDFLGMALGPDYEVVLHDVDNEDAIVAIANGHISGRDIGGPLTNTALQMITSKAYEKSDFLCNYNGLSKDNHILRSSTMFIKNRKGKLVGLLCINFDSKRYDEVQEKLNSIIHPLEFSPQNGVSFSENIYSRADYSLKVSTPITETFPTDIHTLMQTIYDDVSSTLQIPSERLNQKERIKVIRDLKEQGLFHLKGAIPFVAKKLSCSTSSIYRYLGELNN